MYILILFTIISYYQCQETENTTEILDYCEELAKDDGYQVNVTISANDNKSYCVEGGSRVSIFDAVSQDRQYVYLSEHYCANLQHYPITCQQYYHASIYDQQAKANYRKLYEDYKATGIPNSDCLGVARFVFCAEQFKYCNSDDGNTDYEICSFLCTIWQNRCPDYPEVYDRLCKNGGGENGMCSYSQMIIFYFISLLFIS